MRIVAVTFAIAGALFALMLLSHEAGRRLGIRKIKQRSEGLDQGVGAAEGAVFAMLGLLIAFTFSGAAERFERRHQLITEEVNAIGTSYLRLDLLPEDRAREIRKLFHAYVDERASVYQNAENDTLTKNRLKETTFLQSEIWQKALAASADPKAAPQALMLLTPALNEMFDITTTRHEATKSHPPAVIFFLLGFLSLLASLLFGHSTSANRDRPWLHSLVFSAMMSLTFYVILDLEFPRLGLIRVDSADAAFVDLKKSF